MLESGVKPLAVVTGASSGIGYELARKCAEEGYDLYNGTKAFIDSFSFALREELKDSGVTVTCLMPGATETEFFARAGMLDTKVGTDEKDDAAEVAKVGYEAMMRGDGDVVSGWKNKWQTVMANVTPSGRLAVQHRKMAEPGSAAKNQK